MTIGRKFTLTNVVVTVIVLIVGFFILNKYKNDLRDEIYSDVIVNLNSLSELRIGSKLDVGISNATSIANDSNIQEALNLKDRDLAIKTIGSLSSKMKEQTPFKNIQIHIHTSDNHSFLRSWKPSEFGDDLSSFRPSVVKVNSEKKAINGFEIGNDGLSLRAVVPIFKDKNYVGSLEFMQGINSVANDFDKEGRGFLLLMDSNLATSKIKEEDKLNNYLISQKFRNDNFMLDVKTIDFIKLLNDKFFISANYFYTYIDVKDFSGKKLGIALVAEPIQNVEQSISQASNIIYAALIILTLALLFTMINTLLSMKRNILTPILNLKNTIDEIKNNSSETTRIEVKSNDEIGDVVTSFNQYLDSIEKGLIQDQKVIDEAKDIIEKVNAGLFNDSIKGKAHSKRVNSLVDEINSMIRKTQGNLTLVSESLVALSHAKFDHKVPSISNVTGVIASLLSGIKVTQSSINEIMCLIEKSTIDLTMSSKELATASRSLSESSNIQAASLEETAAAIEEISSTISRSSENASNMAKYAQNVTKSTNLGIDLARQTAVSMDEINKEVLQINEAISIIDNIAFQTNILSLNAAVEAATAGEAGKGFAVVAGEVRNLATRSADAANEIKKIVEAATLKAKNGKTITSNMIEGFNELKENIDTTIKLIEDVATASKEQQQAMSQINDTVNSLDQATQKNAILATTINDMAAKTSQLAVSLDETIHQTSFDKDAHKRICDGSMIIEINKLKSDHINFKNYNFSVCKEGEISTVTGSKECNLGKWMAANANEEFAKTNEWQILIESHNLVHKLMQDTIVLYSESKPNSDIFAVTNEIEKHTDIVFDMLNRIREINCQNLQN
ncbi:Cache sensor-containing MCP-domain signal transduction protein (chemoreceptor zinc-binding domain) [Aliarcobacter cibarius]|uniref:Cache sensor-containing MCP-domain signal transduction protein (Chemoreceptor zinc-binding domain) n=1 Tax=Aliarcobacter cibarius TaxID=255507 RepID=A0A5J6RGD7_9BACT|nr:methyl-accepting chemotaxis protein [Aliarcobacter cibarius]QEZ89349.1 Cache sensor-containing MCP-domain signal transduction protein (chemoreceptor zinc-binding domain) [Aliarcobacter cibarius]QKJ27348.1 Cache sensor-containing MCP-domain signal transduction protein (chemoreceptor zinc-binding domain) [Aliarcobacter cibarius]